MFKLQVVGELFFVEVIAALGVGWLLLTSKVGFPPAMRRLRYAGIAWLFALIVTDWYRDTDFTLLLRGEARQVNFLLLLVFFAHLIHTAKSPGRAAETLWVALVLGHVFASLVQPSYNQSFFLWKFGLSLAVSVVTLVVAGRLWTNSPSMISISFAFLTVANVIGGFRSAAAIALVAGLLVRFAGSVGRSSGKNIVRVALLALAASAITIVAYTAVASSGALDGTDLQAKIDSQGATGVNILASGRPETVVGFEAAKQSPFVGYGSWPPLPATVNPTQILSEYGFQDEVYGFRRSQITVIPSHSQVLGTFIEAGPIVLLFWYLASKDVLAGLGRSLASRQTFTPLFVFLGVQFGWDVLFSPFAGEHRVWTALTLASLIAGTAGPRRERSRIV